MSVERGDWITFRNLVSVGLLKKVHIPPTKIKCEKPLSWMPKCSGRSKRVHHGIFIFFAQIQWPKIS